jgi:anthranilate phosphoribosyltransferase
MILEALEKIVAGEDLSRAEAEAVMEESLSGQATPTQMAVFMAVLGMKGVSDEEHAGMEAAKGRHPAQRVEGCNAGAGVAPSSACENLLMVRMLIQQGNDLSRREAEGAMEDILSGRAADAEIATFLAALRFKGETVDELVGFATAMRRHAAPIFPHRGLPVDDALVDTCGTGGDVPETFNISTAAALVVAGAGVRVAKHGNRSVSSRCGSADVLEALGVRIDLTPKRVARAIEEVGIGFLFAPAMHAATRHAMRARREVPIRTAFNLLGPLTNPAGASAQVVGVYDAKLTELLAQALGELGVRRAFVVHGADGLDEISITGETYITELRDAEVRSYSITPEDFGLHRAPLEAVHGGDAQENAKIILRILGDTVAGHNALKHEHGPRREIVLANAAAALVAAGRAADFLDGMRLAAESIDSGAARARLDALASFTRNEIERGQAAP